VAVVSHSVRKSVTLFLAGRAPGVHAAATAHLDDVRAEAFDTLVVEFARSIGAMAIVKGLRRSPISSTSSR